jgi:hypothetical protein
MDRRRKSPTSLSDQLRELITAAGPSVPATPASTARS